MKKAMHILENCTVRGQDGTIHLTCRWDEVKEAIGELDTIMLRLNHQTSNSMLAVPFRVGHTSSMSYRIWYFGFTGNTLQFRETHIGTEEDILACIENARAVRVDRRDSEYGWVTIWLTGIEFLALQQGDLA